MTNKYNLPKHILEQLEKERNPDGTLLSKTQIEAKLDIIARFSTLDLGGEKEPEEVKIRDKSKQKSVEEIIYQGRTPQARTTRDVQEMETNLRESGVEIIQPEQQIDLSKYQPQEAFIFKYDNFGKELIRRSNLRFTGTKAEIPTIGLKTNHEIQNMHVLKRSALLTTIVEDEELKSLNLYPITPLESEALLQGNKLPKTPSTYWEDLGLVLYDHSDKGANSQEAKALFESIKQYKEELGLRNGDLEKRLLVINPGLDVDNSFSRGVKFKVIPGMTKAYKHEILKQTGKNYKFSYGLDNGLPPVNQLGRGNRTLYMPSTSENLGLRALFRYGGLYLSAWFVFLDGSYAVGRVTFAKKSP